MMMKEEAPKASLDQKKLKVMAGRKPGQNRIELKQAILYGIDLSKTAHESQKRKRVSH